jgi:Cu/Ag efflux pump CusA
VQIDPHQLMGDEIGDLTGVPQPIEIKLAAADPAQLSPRALRVAAAIGKIPGVDAVDDGIIPAGDALDFTTDRSGFVPKLRTT